MPDLEQKKLDKIVELFGRIVEANVLLLFISFAFILAISFPEAHAIATVIIDAVFIFVDEAIARAAACLIPLAFLPASVLRASAVSVAFSDCIGAALAIRFFLFCHLGRFIFLFFCILSRGPVYGQPQCECNYYA